MGNVGIIRDQRFLEHMPGPTHPEHPRRLRAVYEMLEQERLEGLLEIPPSFANLQQLELVHTPAYIEKVLKTAEQDHTNLSPDTPVCNRSYVSAFLAAGATISGVRSVMKGPFESCFALIRPPGHHALPDSAGGFCIFNNVAVGVMYALEEFSLERVLVIDWDVHMGNGISQVFYQDPRVFYFSTHRTELFPYIGNLEELGAGDGLGYNLNVPIPGEITTEDFVALYSIILEELVPALRPELTVVAAGFDAHESDPLGRLKINERAFYEITLHLRWLLKKAKTQSLLLVLEGGYDPTGLALCVKETILGLLAPAKKPSFRPTPLAKGLAQEALSLWKQALHRPV